MSEFQPIIDALLACDVAKVADLVKGELDQGKEAKNIMDNGLIAGMDVVGERMENEEMFIPEVLMAAKGMTAGLDILKPLLSEDDAAARGKVAIGTVKGDLHDIGKNLVAMMIGSAGIEIDDLGVDVTPEQFVAAVKDGGADIVCMSALLTTTMPMMKQTIDALTESGLRDKVKVMVGGAPVTQSYADEVGADGYSADAGSAAKLAKTYTA